MTLGTVPFVIWLAASVAIHALAAFEFTRHVHIVGKRLQWEASLKADRIGRMRDGRMREATADRRGAKTTDGAEPRRRSSSGKG